MRDAGVEQGAAVASYGAPPLTSRLNARLRLYLLSILVDIGVLAASFAAANVLVLGSLLGEPGKPHGLVMFAMIAPVFTLIAVNAGVYGIRMIDDARGNAWRALWAFCQAVMLMLIIVYLGKIAEQLSRLTFLTGVLLGGTGLVAVRPALMQVARATLGDMPRLVLLIADGVDVDPPRAAHLVDAAALGIDPARHDARMAARLARVVGSAERVVVACPAERMEDWRTALASLSARGEIMVPEMRRFAPAKASDFEDHPTLIVAGGPLHFRDRVLKRVFDIAVSSAAIIGLSPILVGAAIAVRLSGPGPILFRQPRLGRDARPFDIYKFRSMHHAMTDLSASQLTQKDDPRVTRVGAFLRKSSIDELPQLFNVLLGDMSIVGPRPHAPAARAADSLYWEVDARYWARHCIKPGMTGLAQVRGHRGPTDRHEDLLNRLQSDLEYVTNWSVWRDLRILAATLRVVAHDNAF
jgi:exopolysaccharide biosynthesis polyprenyl glycosylphosphotransferase